ncbi:MAG TPA: energy transducer TonB [Casimicrobiaceae bacterium]|nr:energy transducer TonB [Casimicrobiaceae bacterium]
MDYARQQRDPTKHAIGIVFVVLFHVLLIYALVNGLGRAIVEVVKKPLSATIIEELKLPPPPPPPPPKKIVEQAKPQPQETYVPPPDVPVATSTAPAITATTTTAPTEPHVIQTPVVAPPPPAPKPAIRRGVTKISGENPEFPRAAQKDNIARGRVVARMNIDEQGNVTEVTIFSAEPQRYFDRAVITALKTWKFAPEGEKYIAEVEINFKLPD